MNESVLRGGIIVPTRRTVWLAASGTGALLLVPWVPGVVYAVVAFDVLLLSLVLFEGWSLRRRMAVRIERRVGGRLSLGEAHSVMLRVESLVSARLRTEIEDDIPEAFHAEGNRFSLELEPYASASHSYRITPTRRGDHRFGAVAIRVWGELGLCGVNGQLPAAQLVKVYPSLKGLRRLELATRFLEQSSGFRSLRREGGGDEFEKLREYLPDDDFRHIDWKATARRHRPVTRIFEAERNQTVVIGIDTGRAMAAQVGDLTKLDHAINAALLVAYAALRFDDQVGLLLFSDEVQSFVPPRKGMPQLRRITDALYGAEATLRFVDFRGPLRFLRARVRRRALLVLFTDLLDEDHVRPLVNYTRRLGNRHLPLLVTLSDPAVIEAARRPPSTTDEVYGQVVATEILHERAALLKTFRSEGAQIVDAPSDRISTAAVNRYLELKRARRL